MQFLIDKHSKQNKNTSKNPLRYRNFLMFRFLIFACFYIPFLVDSVTSLIQNSLFPVEKNYEMDLAGANRCADELIEFAKTVRHAVFVSDYIYSDAEVFSESTEQYRKCLADIDRRLAKVCDTVIEVSAGQLIIHKGDLCI